MGDRSQEQEQEFAGPPEPLEQLPEAPQRAVEAVPEPYRWIALLVVAVGVFIVFMLVLRQLRSHRRNETEELRESVFTTNLLQAQLSDLWARLRSRFGPAAEEPDPFLSLEGEIDTRHLIRSIYQRLLAVAQGRVAARLQAETPFRYGDRLSTHPDVDASLMQTITDAYVEGPLRRRAAFPSRRSRRCSAPGTKSNLCYCRRKPMTNLKSQSYHRIPAHRPHSVWSFLP